MNQKTNFNQQKDCKENLHVIIQDFHHILTIYCLLQDDSTVVFAYRPTYHFSRNVLSKKVFLGTNLKKLWVSLKSKTTDYESKNKF